MNNLKIVAAIFSEQNKVLAMKRAAHKPAAGKWEFPGGKIEPGETPEQAIKREIREELNIEITRLTHFDNSKTFTTEWEVELDCFLVESDSMPTESTDHDEMRWVEIDNLHNLDWLEADLAPVSKLMNQGFTEPRD